MFYILIQVVCVMKLMKKKNSLLINTDNCSRRNGKYFQHQTSFSNEENRVKFSPDSRVKISTHTHTCSASIADHNMKLGRRFFNFKPTFILLTFIFSTNSYFITQQNYQQGTESLISCNLILKVE